MDERWIVEFRIIGTNFRPSSVPFAFTQQHDPGVIGTLKSNFGERVPYGSAKYEVPSSVPVKERIKHLVQTIEPLLSQIREAGAEDWHVSIGRFYFGQCNEEYSLEELQLIARLDCGFIYSAYEISEEKERDYKEGRRPRSNLRHF
jgi:hypothetical protein